MNKQKFTKAFWPILYTLSAGFVIYYLIKSGNSFHPVLNVRGILFIIIGFVFNILAYGLRGGIWAFMVRRHHKLPVLKLLLSFFSSEIIRYVPGNVWSVISRLRSTGNLGVKKTTVGYFFVVENITMILMAFLFSILSISLINVSSYLLYLLVGLGLFILLMVLFIRPDIVKKILSIASKKLHVDLDYKDFKKTDLVLIAIFFNIYWVLFGFSFYFVALAFGLSTFSIITAIGINTAAWLIGYLSLLTPSGLGVREATFVLLLSKYTSSTISLSVAIVSRIVFTLAELFWIAVLIGIIKFGGLKEYIKNKAVSIYKDKYLLAIILIVLVYIIYFSITTILRHYNLYSGRYDLGDMDQTVWNTIHGRIFEMVNPDNDNIVSRMAFHGDVMLILIAPLYYIYDSPNTLLILQSIVIGISAIPLYLLGKEIVKNRLVAFGFAISLLLYPALEWVNVYDFHVVSFCIPLFLFAFLLIYKDKYWTAFILCLLAILTKEEIGLVVFMVGLYIMFIRRKYRIGALFSLVGIFASFLFIWILIPHFRPNDSAHFALVFYSQYGDTPTKILKGMLLHPIALIESIFGYQSIVYLYELLMPVGFLAILSPATLVLSVSELGINMLSNNYYMKTIYLQYTSAIIPFIYISSLYGYVVAKKVYEKVYIKSFKPKIKMSYDTFAFWLIVVLALLGNYAWGVLPMDIQNINYVYKYNSQAAVIEKISDELADKYSVSASDSIAPHFTHRQYEYVFPIRANNADVIIVKKSEKFEIVDKHISLSTLDYLLENKRYDLQYTDKDLYVFVKKSTGLKLMV